MVLHGSFPFFQTWHALFLCAPVFILVLSFALSGFRLDLMASLHTPRFRTEMDQENESIFEMTCRKRATETKRSRDSFGPGLTDCAPAFGVRGACSRFTKRGQQCWRWQTAGKPDAFQTLRGPRRHLLRRASIRSAFGLRLNAHNNQITCGGCPSWLWIDQ